MDNLQIEHRNDFGKLLERLNLNGVGAEIGVERGKFSGILLHNTKLSKIYLIDSWKSFDKTSLGMRNFPQERQDKLYRIVVDSFGKYTDRIKIIRNESLIASRMFNDLYFDFIYIDANHSYDFIRDDINAWYPKVKVGGILAGHDYRNGLVHGVEYGVKQAVDEFCASNNKKLYHTLERHRRAVSWYILK